MSLQAVEYSRTQSGLKITEKSVLNSIAYYLNTKTNMAWPSVSTLAADCSMSERTVTRALASLEEKKLIRRAIGGGKQRTIYELPGFKPQNLGCSTDDRIPPRQSVTPDRNEPTTPVRNDTTPVRNDTPNKERSGLDSSGERHQEQKASLALQNQINPNGNPNPLAPQVLPPRTPAVFSWDRYARGEYGRGRGGWQPRMSAQVERALNQIARYGEDCGPQAAARLAREILPPSWQSYLGLGEAA